MVPTNQARRRWGWATGARAVVGDDRLNLSHNSRQRPDLDWRTSPLRASTTAFAGAGGTQVWQNNLGDYLSTDAGASWTAAAPLEAPRFGYYTWLAGPPGRLLGVGGTSGMLTTASADGGRTWTTSAVPDPRAAAMILAAALGTGGSAIALTGQGAQCLTAPQVRKVERVKPGWKPPSGTSLLFTSGNGGAHWDSAAIVLPFGVGVQAAATVDGRHSAIIDACNRVQVSSDGGAHWRAHALAKGVFCTMSALRSELWLGCESGTSTFWVLHSADEGSTWTIYRLPHAAAVNGLSAIGSSTTTALALLGIAAARQGSAVIPAGGSIWRSTDAGRSWAQSWPVLPG